MVDDAPHKFGVAVREKGCPGCAKMLKELEDPQGLQRVSAGFPHRRSDGRRRRRGRGKTCQRFVLFHEHEEVLVAASLRIGRFILLADQRDG